MVNLNIGWRKTEDELPPKERPFMIRIVPPPGINLETPLGIAVYSFEEWKAQNASFPQYMIDYCEWSEVPDGTYAEYQEILNDNRWKPISEYSGNRRAILGWFPAGMPGFSVDHRYVICHGRKVKWGDKELTEWKNNYGQLIRVGPTFFQHLTLPE